MFCVGGGGGDFSWILLTGFIWVWTCLVRSVNDSFGWFLLYWFQNSSVLLLDWHDTFDEVDMESENVIDEDLDLKILKGKEASLRMNLEPKENELLLGRDCLRRDSTKPCLCLPTELGTPWDPRDLSAIDLDLASDIFTT